MTTAPEVREEFACRCEEGNPNDVYVVAVKTNTTKTIQIKCNNVLCSFHVHHIINLVPTEPKLAHNLVKLAVRPISHFAMNIIIDETC